MIDNQIKKFTFENQEQSNIIPASAFTDNAILQRETSVPVWGFTKPAFDGKKITISFKNQEKSAIVKDCKWQINLDAMQADKNSNELLITCEYEQIIYKNILIGDVWFASGQSNMCFYIEYLQGDARTNIENDCEYPNISLFITNEALSKEEKNTVDKISWRNPCKDTINTSHFSTISFLFARELYKNLDIPIGILVAAYGGTRIETWLNRAILKNSKLPTYEPVDIECAYNAMLLPHIPYAFKGMIWYQGEGNAMPLEFNQYYSDYVSLMVKHYRDVFNNPQMPFYQVGLPSYGLEDADYKNIRFEQMECDEELENSYTTVNFDTGNPNDIHPTDKLPVGFRLANLALEHTYNIKKNNFYPILENAKKDDKNVILTFKTDENGLEILNKKINTLEIEDEDGIYYNLEMSSSTKNTITINCDSLKNPINVRYAYNSNVIPCHLFGKNGLPAKAFKAKIN